MVCLQQAVGISDETRWVLKERLLEDERRGPYTGPVLLGMIVGLMAAELHAEAAPEAA